MAKNERTLVSSMTFEDLRVRDAIWQCGDCGNYYTMDVQSCANKVLDILAVNGLVKNGSR